MIYVAEPIDLMYKSSMGPRAVLFGWKRELEVELKKRSWSAYMPSMAFKVGEKAVASDVLEKINYQALARCDAMVALLPVGVESIGVPMEIERAVWMGKPVVVVRDEGEGESWSLAFREKHTEFKVVRRPGKGVEWMDELDWEAIAEKKRGRLPLKVKVDPGGALPRRGYDSDCGFDLITLDDTEIKPGEFQDVSCGVSIEMPPGYWAMITGRSSTLRRRGLMVATGIIDSGYRGKLFAGCWNLGEKVEVVEKGERIAQLICYSNVTGWMEIMDVEHLSESDRGVNGFGSTGR